MKRISIYLGAWVMMALTLASCTKEFIPGEQDTRVVAAYIKELAAGNDILKKGAVATSVVTKTVGQVGVEISEVKVYAVAEESTTKSDWKLVKTVPFTEGMELSDTRAEIATALGVDPESLEEPVLYQEVVTKDGRSFDVATNIPSNYESFPNYHMAMTWYLSVE